MSETSEAGWAHTRTEAEFGPDFCRECSDAASEWVQWPCSVKALVAAAVDRDRYVRSLDAIRTQTPAPCRCGSHRRHPHGFVGAASDPTRCTCGNAAETPCHGVHPFLATTGRDQ